MGRGNQPLNYRQFNVRNTKKKKERNAATSFEEPGTAGWVTTGEKNSKTPPKTWKTETESKTKSVTPSWKGDGDVGGRGGGRDRKTIHATWLPNERSFQNEKKKIFLVIFSLSLSVWVQSTSRPRSATSSSTALRVNPSQRVERSENKCAIKWLKYIF